MTLAQFNRKLKAFQMVCVNGKGYFYFMALGNKDDSELPSSVYTMRFSDLNETEWLECAGLN